MLQIRGFYYLCSLTFPTAYILALITALTPDAPPIVFARPFAVAPGEGAPLAPGRRPPVVPETCARWRCRHCRAASPPPAGTDSRTGGNLFNQQILEKMLRTA